MTERPPEMSLTAANSNIVWGVFGPRDASDQRHADHLLAIVVRRLRDAYSDDVAVLKLMQVAHAIRHSPKETAP